LQLVPWITRLRHFEAKNGHFVQCKQSSVGGRALKSLCHGNTAARRLRYKAGQRGDPGLGNFLDQQIRLLMARLKLRPLVGRRKACSPPSYWSFASRSRWRRRRLRGAPTRSPKPTYRNRLAGVGDLYYPTPKQMGGAQHRAGQRGELPRRASDRRQDRGRRGPRDAGVFRPMRVG